MKVLTKPQLAKKLAAQVDRNEQNIKLIGKLHKENDSMGARAAGFESQIEELNTDSATYRARIEYLENELQEREQSLHTLESDITGIELGHSRQIDTLKQDLYNEQLKSTAYLTVIKTLNER